MKIKDLYKMLYDYYGSTRENKIELDLLLEYVLNKDKLFLKLNLDYNVEDNKVKKLLEYVDELKNNKPIDYILKRKCFYGYDFKLDENVLIPRWDTEILVENAIEKLKNKIKGGDKLKGLELGIGTGIISISILKELKEIEMLGLDINENAIKISKENSVNLLVNKRLEVKKSDLFSYCENKSEYENAFDFIISNPPYIEEKEYLNLDKKILDYEPKSALLAENNGLYFYNEILKNAKKYLKKDKFFIFFEIGYNQGNDLKNIFKKYNYNGKVTIINDYEGFQRVVLYEN